MNAKREAQQAAAIAEIEIAMARFHHIPGQWTRWDDLAAEVPCLACGRVAIAYSGLKSRRGYMIAGEALLMRCPKYVPPPPTLAEQARVDTVLEQFGVIDGAELARRRKALGLSQTALADALGLTQATISRYETETRDIEQPKLIARAMRDVEHEYARADADYDISRDQADADRPFLPAIDEAF